jgi:hypothetical protein
MPDSETFQSKSRDILQAVCAEHRAKGALTIEAVEDTEPDETGQACPDCGCQLGGNLHANGCIA